MKQTTQNKTENKPAKVLQRHVAHLEPVQDLLTQNKA